MNSFLANGAFTKYYVKQLGAGGAVRISMTVESSLVDCSITQGSAESGSCRRNDYNTFMIITKVL